MLKTSHRGLVVGFPIHVAALGLVSVSRAAIDVMTYSPAFPAWGHMGHGDSDLQKSLDDFGGTLSMSPKKKEAWYLDVFFLVLLCRTLGCQSNRKMFVRPENCRF